MKQRSFAIPAFLAAALTAAGAAAQPLYSIRDLGATAGVESRPFAINESGVVAALNRTNATDYRAFRYARGAWTNLGTLGGNYSRAEDVGAGGHIAGTSTNGGNTRRGFLWTPGGVGGVAGNVQMREIGTLGGAVSEAFSVNATGLVAGMAATATPREQAILWNNGVFTHIGGPIASNLNHEWSYAYGLNERGDAVGESYNNNFTVRSAFLFTNGAVRHLGDLGGGAATALAINSNRTVTGYASIAGGFDRAFRWSQNVMTNLGTLGSGIVSYGYAINNQGHIVGASTIDATYTNQRAFIAFSNTMTDLNALVDDSGTNWVLLEARGINDSGQIVGLGRRATSVRMFLLNPIPAIRGIFPSDTNVLVQFQSIRDTEYILETASNLVGGAWIPSGLVVTGNGGVATAPHPVGSAAQLQRVRLATP